MRKIDLTLLAVLILLGQIFCPSSLTAANLSKTEVHDIFSQAKDYFRQANNIARDEPAKAILLYTKAVRRFERIVNDGAIQNGKLYYNIGNTYFYMNDIGRAILNYRRALKFIPYEENLLQNLEYAISKRLDRIEEQEQTKILKTLLFWHYDFTALTRSVIFLICFVGFWVVAIIRLFNRRDTSRWLLICLGVFAVSFFSSVMYEQVISAKNRAGVVLADEIIARKGDGSNYEPAFKEHLHAGTEFTLVESRVEWYHLELLDGRRCWVPKKSIELI